MTMAIGNITKMIATDETVAAASTHTQGAEFTAVDIDVRNKRIGTIMFYVKGGNASASGNIVFTVQTSPDKVNWFDEEAKTVIMSGTSLITDTTASYPVKFDGYGYVRLSTIQNTDASYTCETNVALFIKE